MRGIAAQAMVRGADGTVGALDLIRVDRWQNGTKWSPETTTATKSTAAELGQDRLRATTHGKAC